MNWFGYILLSILTGTLLVLTFSITSWVKADEDLDQDCLENPNCQIVYTE
jgi:hypothetical protein